MNGAQLEVLDATLIYEIEEALFDLKRPMQFVLGDDIPLDLGVISLNLVAVVVKLIFGGIFACRLERST